jgi:hypothetical protein
VKFVAAALLLLVGAWIGYVILGNWYIRERLPQRLNENPASFLATWDRARTWWPGSIRASGVRLRKASDAVQWEMRLDEGKARFGLVPLLFEHLSVNGLRGDGLTVRVRFVPGRTPGREEGSPHAPPIEGLPDPPLPVPTGPKSPPLTPGERWTYHIDGLSLGGVREVWVGPFRFAGAARVQTDMAFTPSESIAVGDFRFEVESGEVSVGPDVMAADLVADVELDLDRFDMRERKSTEVFEEMTVRAQAKASLHDVQLPRASFPRIPWLGFGGGIGAASLDLRVEDGSFAPGSTMRLEAPSFTVEYPGYVVSGAAVVDGDVSREGGPARARATATFGGFTILKHGAPSAHVRGEGFSAELRTTDLTILDPLETFEVEMTLPDSEIVSFDAYDASIPAPLRVKIDSGKGTIRGSLLVDEKGGSGSLGLDGKDIRLRHADDLMSLDMLLEARIPTLDMAAGTFDFTGTELKMRNARMLSGGTDERFDGWWGDILLDAMRLQRGGDPLATMEVSGKFRDTRPFVAIVARDRPLLKLVRPVLVAPDAKLHARLTAGPSLLDLDELTLTGEKLDLRACVDARGTSARGVFWVDGGALSAGYKFQDGRSNLKPLAGKAWFPEHAPLCENPAHLPPD